MNNYCAWCHQSDDYRIPLLSHFKPDFKPGPYELKCTDCGRKIDLISIEAACKVAGKTRKTIYQWINKGLINTVRLTNDRLLICYSSLFLPPKPPSEEYH